MGENFNNGFIDMIKQAVSYSPDDMTFVLGQGETIGHFVNVWNKDHPDRKITVPHVLDANEGTPSSKFKAGTKYVIPSRKEYTQDELAGMNNPRHSAITDWFYKRTPVGTFARDVTRKRINNAARALGLTADNKSILPGGTVTSLSNDQMDWLRQAILAKTDNWVTNSGSFGGVRLEGGRYVDDYKRLVHPGFRYAAFPNTDNEADSELKNKLRTAKWRNTGVPNQMEYMLGDWTWNTDENGDVIVKDTYDFNEGEGKNGKGTYGTFREWASQNASTKSDPDSQKTKFRVNLGNPATWGKFDEKKFRSYNEPYRSEFPELFKYNDEVPVENKSGLGLPLAAGATCAAAIAGLIASTYKDDRVEQAKALVGKGILPGTDEYDEAMKKWRRKKLLRSVALSLLGGTAAGATAKILDS